MDSSDQIVPSGVSPLDLGRGCSEFFEREKGRGWRAPEGEH